MSLRRLAQANNAAVHTGSPRSPESNSGKDSPRMSLPSTPRNRTCISAYRSPASTPSISSSIPFDWEAARSRKPAPYGTLGQNRVRGAGTPVKRVVREKGFVERITSIPSRVAFEISLFPHNVPLPEAATLGRLVGGVLHFLHFCVRVSQSRKVPDSDLGWEDMYHEDEGTSWFDWTTPTAQAGGAGVVSECTICVCAAAGGAVTGVAHAAWDCVLLAVAAGHGAADAGGRKDGAGAAAGGVGARAIRDGAVHGVLAGARGAVDGDGDGELDGDDGGDGAGVGAAARAGVLVRAAGEGQGDRCGRGDERVQRGLCVPAGDAGPAGCGGDDARGGDCVAQPLRNSFHENPDSLRGL
ncbi:hypothetical protein E4T56_gene19409 [Termitomyces sp. T112]|nr:hypothetical protein E4T56_gene19409 [Termitomyces sp. T112]